jgi:hypothetical protein
MANHNRPGDPTHNTFSSLFPESNSSSKNMNSKPKAHSTAYDAGHESDPTFVQQKKNQKSKNKNNNPNAPKRKNHNNCNQRDGKAQSGIENDSDEKIAKDFGKGHLKSEEYSFFSRLNKEILKFDCTYLAHLSPTLMSSSIEDWNCPPEYNIFRIPVSTGEIVLSKEVVFLSVFQCHSVAYE